MSLVKLLSVPVKLFQKEVIAFMIVRRHDLGRTDDLIRYISVKPNSSIRQLRQKIWYLLDLPDYCDEIIVLKTNENVEIPLTALRKGNQPNRPFILEVWLPLRPAESMASFRNNMLTMRRELEDDNMTRTSDFSIQEKAENIINAAAKETTMTENTYAMHKLHVTAPFKKPDLPTRISKSSIILKLQGKKSRDDLTNVLLKIQSDLCTLSEKLSNLENKIQH